MRKQYRVVRRILWRVSEDDEHESISPDRRCKAGSLAQAKKRLLLYGPEPWLAFDKKDDDIWCCGQPPCDPSIDCEEGFWVNPCSAEHVTAKEFFLRQRSQLFGQVLEAWIEVREVSPWQKFSSASLKVERKEE